MRNICYAAKTLLIVTILAFLAIHAKEINKAFVTWLAAPPPALLVQCYNMKAPK